MAQTVEEKLIATLARTAHDQGGRVAQIDDDGVATIEYTDYSLTLNFGRMLRRVAYGEEVEAVVHSVLSAYKPLESPVSLDILHQGLRLAFEPKEILEQDQNLIFAAFDDDIIISLQWVDPEGSGIRLISKWTIVEWAEALETRLSSDELWEIAQDNMERLVEEDCHPSIDHIGEAGVKVPIGLLGTNSSFKASFILAPSALKLKFGGTDLGWPLRAVIPSRDFAYLIPDDERGDCLTGLGEVVLQEYDEAPYRLSKSIFRITDDGIELVGSFFHNDAKALEKARQLRAAGDTEGALSCCIQALELNPDMVEAYLEMAYIHRESGRHDEAIRAFTSVIERHPEAGNICCMRAISELVCGQTEAAISDLARALEFDGTDVLAYVYRGMAFQQLERWSDAITDFSAAILIDPSDAANYEKRGYSFSMLNSYARAFADFNRCLQLDPTNSMARYRRGVLRREFLQTDDCENDDLASTFLIKAAGEKNNQITFFNQMRFCLPSVWRVDTLYSGSSKAICKFNRSDERNSVLYLEVETFCESDANALAEKGEQLIADMKAEPVGPASANFIKREYKSPTGEFRASQHWQVLGSMPECGFLRMATFLYVEGSDQSGRKVIEALEACIRNCEFLKQAVDADSPSFYPYHG